MPGLASVVVFWDPATATIQTKAIGAAAKVLNIKIEIMEIKTPGKSSPRWMPPANAIPMGCCSSHPRFFRLMISSLRT